MLSAFTLLVKDYDSAISFFVDKLGFVVREDVLLPDSEQRWLVVASSDNDGVGIILSLAQSHDAHLVGKQAGSSVLMILETDNFDQRYQQMIDCGVEFEEAPRTETYGKVVIFKDLYGNKWDLIQRF